jgi:hypothetical protein
MNQIELAMIEECAIKCAKEIHKTTRLFKSLNPADRNSLKKEIENMTRAHVTRLENAN